MESHVGLGLRHPHYAHVMEHQPAVSWFEVHSENFMMPGGFAPYFLTAVRNDYPLSFHGIGLALGSESGVEEAHVQRLKEIVDYYEPILLSDHLSWARVGGYHMADLLPVPYTQESLAVFRQNIDCVQNILKRPLMIENPSTYMEYKDSDMTESDFMAELASTSGCFVLLDINNIYVSCANHGWDPKAYIDKIPGHLIQEIHLAGHSIKEFPEGILRIDTHSDHVCQEVWSLYRYAIDRFGQRPTLIEWDEKIPTFDVLYQEGQKAQTILDQHKDKNHVAIG